MSSDLGCQVPPFWNLTSTVLGKWQALESMDSKAEESIAISFLTKAITPLEIIHRFLS